MRENETLMLNRLQERTKEWNRLQMKLQETTEEHALKVTSEHVTSRDVRAVCWCRFLCCRFIS